MNICKVIFKYISAENTRFDLWYSQKEIQINLEDSKKEKFYILL